MTKATFVNFKEMPTIAVVPQAMSLWTWHRAWLCRWCDRMPDFDASAVDQSKCMDALRETLLACFFHHCRYWKTKWTCFKIRKELHGEGSIQGQNSFEEYNQPITIQPFSNTGWHQEGYLSTKNSTHSNIPTERWPINRIFLKWKNYFDWTEIPKWECL